MASDTTRSADAAQDTGRPGVEVAGPRFRVRTPNVATPWLPDPPSHRHRTLVG